MVYVLLTVLHVAVCLVLIMVVLLQTGKRADLAGAFGGGGSQTAFGARGAATFLSRATTWSAVLFMFTSLALALLATSGRGGGSVLDNVPASSTSAPVQRPAAPSSPSGTPPGGQTQPAQSQPPAGGSGGN